MKALYVKMVIRFIACLCVLGVVVIAIAYRTQETIRVYCVACPIQRNASVCYCIVADVQRRNNHYIVIVLNDQRLKKTMS